MLYLEKVQLFWRRKWNQKNTGDMGSDRIIYSPNITVFKSDDEIPEMLADWFQVDVISCVAPYYDAQKKKPVSKQKLEEVFRKLLIDQRYAMYFEKIVFAIKKTGDVCPNYETFRSVFEE